MMRIRYVPRFVPFAVVDLPIHVNFYLLKRNSSDDYISKESKCKNPSTERRRYFQKYNNKKKSLLSKYRGY